MKKILSNIFFVLIICALCININVKPVYADTDDTSDTDGISDVFGGASDFIEAGEDDSDQQLDQSLKPISDMIYNILLAIGVCIAVIFAGILGIKFMIGSVEEKAQIKDALIPFVIGCVVIFGAFGFWKIMVTIGNQL